ncbi:hypothetical protein HanPSC8_Chr17g0748991 [Helianthus annuus]|nr:hypothetical protein HanPSC8_Chr17g0748991 [Helianthus annuus]
MPPLWGIIRHVSSQSAWGIIAKGGVVGHYSNNAHIIFNPKKKNQMDVRLKGM